jgi:hypothetical protein
MPTETTEPLPDKLRARVLELAAQTPSPTRRTVKRRTLLWFGAGMALPLALFVLIGGAEQGPRPSILFALTSSGTLSLSLVALGAALGRGGRALGPSRARFYGIVLLLPVLLTLLKVGSSSVFPGMTAAWLSRPGLRCFGVSLLLGLVPLVAFLVARRHSDPVHPRAFGAALGAAGGFWAATLVDLWCPVGYPLHVVLGHALPTLVLAALGAWAGSRVLATPGWTEPR